MSFRHLQVGDIVKRKMGLGGPVKLKITELDDDFIYCGPPGVGWKFNRDQGYEVDEEMGWGIRQGNRVTMTGSYLEAGE
jgi:hypothetical protein